NQIPNVKVALEGLSTQYQSAKQAYDDLLKKSSDASMQFNREENAQGETIRVQDAANLPESPVAPKRALLTGFGAAIGLAIGLLLAAVFELPRIFKIQNIEDAKHYTGLPVLASVPPLLSGQEKLWLKRSHRMRLLAGVILALGAIPLIAFVLQLTKVFERVVS
ncbi:MAG TPA: GNVR domain-containing protein, partial [Pyrinomonadaceae bacterium]|nr:GNVR domain-containing protein [Pyrinomonadaceae bacterium]